MTNMIKKAFNRAAKSYNDHCQLQQTIGEHLLRLLPPAHSDAPRMIDLGCGTGLITEKLASTYCYSEFHALDFAESLLQKARERLSQHEIILHHADFNCLPESDLPFDIIFSNMALHWSVDMFATLKSLIASLSDQGVIAFSIPLTGTFAELKNHFAINPFYDTATIAKHLYACGYEITAYQAEKIVRGFEDTRSALKSIKQVGANATRSASKTFLSKTRLKQINIHTLTYHIGYFIATKSGDACQKNISLREQTPTLAKPTLASIY